MGFLTTTDTAKTPRRLEMTSQAMTDLMLDTYLGRIFEGHHGSKPLDWAAFLTCDTEDLLYRREVLTELEKDPALVQDIDEVCKTIAQIRQRPVDPVAEPAVGVQRRLGSPAERLVTDVLQHLLQRVLRHARAGFRLFEKRYGIAHKNSSRPVVPFPVAFPDQTGLCVRKTNRASVFTDALLGSQ